MTVALAAIVAVSTPAFAGRDGGGGDGGGGYGESLYNDLQRNPELIEPGAQQRRYLEYYGGAGWDRRWAAYYGYPAYQPNVQVRPQRGSGYGYRGYGYGY